MHLHQPNRREWIVALGASLAGGVHAQSPQGRPLRLLVGYSAGGGVDAMARLVAAELAPRLGQPVNVENRPGASGLIAAEAVAQAAADGQTLLVGETGMLIASVLRGGRGIDPLKALQPVSGLFVLPLMVVANNDTPIRDPSSLVSALKARPGHYAYATSGVGTVHHLGFELFKEAAGLFAVHIPYRGASQIVPDVIGAQVPLGVVSATAAMSQHRAGRLRAVATMSASRVPGAEEVPPLSDVIAGFDVAPRLALFAPAQTPAAALQRLATALQQITTSSSLAAAATAQGALVAPMAAGELARDLERESAKWTRVVRERRIVAE